MNRENNSISSIRLLEDTDIDAENNNKKIIKSAKKENKHTKRKNDKKENSKNDKKENSKKPDLLLVDKDDQKRSGRPNLTKPILDNDKLDEEFNKKLNKELNGISLKDVIGHDEIKDQLKRMLNDYCETDIRIALKESGLPLPKGIIIYGLSGVGKSFLAKAVVNDVIRHNPKLRYQFIKGTKLLASSQIKTAEVIRDFFSNINKINESEKKETVIIIDEIDSLLSSRSSKSVITKKRVEVLLEEEFGSEGIYIIGTTNRLHEIDIAILSRFYRLEASLPNTEERLRLFEHYFKAIKIKDRHIFLQLADDTEGWTGRDISHLASDLFVESRTKNITIDYKDIKYFMSHKFHMTYKDALKERLEYGRRYKNLEQNI